MLRHLVETTWSRRTPWGRALAAGLTPASLPYVAAIALRNRLYDTGRLPVTRVTARVVSVGNLTVGGSGKTPLVLWLAERLVARGRRVAIVARGYRKQRPGVVIVGRHGRALVSTGDGGDEAVLLAQRFAGPVITGEDRVAAARTACDECGAEIVILDDGFQHRRLARDLDVVVLGADPRAQRLLPAGPLREGAGALRRAGAIVLMDEAGAWLPAVAPSGLPVLRAETRAQSLLEANGGQWRECDVGRLAGRETAVVAGIARPGRVIAQLERLGARVRETRLLDDHHVYDARDVAWVEAAARRGPVITTEKDLVKLVEVMEAPPVLALRVALEVTPAEELLRLAAGEDVVCGGSPAGKEVTK